MSKNIRGITMKRTISQPVGFDGKEVQGYFMISNKDAASAILNKLTGSQIRLWLYLMMIDTYADFTSDGETIYHSIPSPTEMSFKLGIARDTVQKDMRKLKKLGLYDYRITQWQGHNSAAAKAKQESDALKRKKSHRYPKNQRANNPHQGLNNPSSEINTPQTQSGDSKGLISPSQGLNSPQQRLNNPSKRLNNPYQPPKSASAADPIPSQTIQTIQTPQTGGGVKNFSLDSDLDWVNKKVDDTEQNYSEQATAKKEKLVNNKNSGDDQSSADVVPITTKRATSQEIYPKKNNHEAADIPQDLISKLKDLGISLDEQVKRTIADHDISQSYGAIKHVENTWESINNPRGVFLFQIPKQRVQKGPSPISETFLEWYQWAIADGLVIDYPAKYLPTNYRGEPKVKLTIDPNWAEDWEKVRDNPDDYRQLIDPKLKKELWAKVGTMLGRPPKPEPEPTLNDQLSDPILGPELYPKIKHSHHIEFTEEGRPYQATPITDIEYDENGVPLGEVK